MLMNSGQKYFTGVFYLPVNYLILQLLFLEHLNLVNKKSVS